MKMKRFKEIIQVVAVAGTFCVVAAGCGKSIKPDTPIQNISAPEWVVKGKGAFTKEKSKAFYGVGSASGIQNVSLLRTTADNRARNEIAKTVQAYIASLMKDYSGSTTGGEGKANHEGQNVEHAVKTVTAMTLSGVEIIDHWQNSATGEFYSLATLDMEAFKENLDRVKELDSRARDYIKQSAERFNQQLEKEEEKMRLK